MDITSFLSDSSQLSDVQHILEERALALARQDGSADAERGEEIIIFQLGNERYGIPASFIHEVQPLKSYTRLPAAPLWLIGLVNVRGRLLSALDIRPLLGIEPAPPRTNAYLLILGVNGIEVSLLADTVIEIQHATLNLAPTPSVTAGHGVAWVRGVDLSLNIIIDPHLLLSDPRLIVNDVVE